MTSTTLFYLGPEIILVLAATMIYVAGAFVASRWVWNGVALGALAIAGVVLAAQGGPGQPLPPLAGDSLAVYLRWLALVVGLLFVLLTSREAAGRQGAEHVGTVLMAVSGIMLSAGAADLVLLFVGLEMVSIPTYVLLAMGRRDAPAQEAAAKYFFLSILSSAILLYGFSFLYGLTGSTRLDLIQSAMAARTGAGGLGVLALVLIVAGLGFKIAAVPFHFYAPDVYQGTTNGNAGLLSVAPKAAGLVALTRLAVWAMPGMEELGWRTALILSVLTMTLGNVLALWQDNVRRLLAYSSIAHAGYMLIGVAAAYAQRSTGVEAGQHGAAGQHDIAGQHGVAGQLGGDGASVFYLAMYVLATTGAFAALVYLGRGDREIDQVDDLAGLGRTRPLAALALAVTMFSLAGIPPLGGFWGKLTLFGSALGVSSGPSAGQGVVIWFRLLAVIGVLNAAVAAAYYLRIVGAMYFRPPAADEDTLAGDGGRGAWAAMLIAAILVLAAGLYPRPILDGAAAASAARRSDPPRAASRELVHRRGH